jgi:hypothetical protein
MGVSRDRPRSQCSGIGGVAANRLHTAPGSALAEALPPCYGGVVTSPHQQSERRRAKRAVAAFPVRLEGQGAEAPAILRDISEIGMACSAPQAIAEMTLVGLDFMLPGQSETHRVKGAVVRCEPLPKAGKEAARFDLAVYFTEMTPVTRAALRNYVAKAKPAR